MRPLIFGEVLFDCFPDGSEVLGGAPFNTAWHLQGLGLAPLMVSRVGDDEAGRRALRAMADWGMEAGAVEVDPVHATGAVTVELAGGEPRYAIDPGQAYGYIEAAGTVEVSGPVLLYHGSLALWQEGSRRALDELAARLSAPIFLDVNLRAPWWQSDSVAAWLERATWAKLNLEELRRLAGAGEVRACAERLCRERRLERVVVTLGEAGAVTVDAGGAYASVQPVSGTAVVDTVGAGDAFAAVLMLGLIRGWDTATALARAQAFASAIVGVRGATVADPAFYEGFRKDWGLA